MTCFVPNRNAQRAGLQISSILSTDLDNRDLIVDLPSPTNQHTQPLIPKLPSEQCKDILSRLGPTAPITDDVRASNASLKAAAANSIKELNRLKTRQSVSDKIKLTDKSTKTQPIPKISRLHPEKHDASMFSNPSSHQSTYRRSRKHSINEALHNSSDFAGFTDSRQSSGIEFFPDTSGISSRSNEQKQSMKVLSRVNIDGQIIKGSEDVDIDPTFPETSAKTTTSSNKRPASSNFAHASTGRLLDAFSKDGSARRSPSPGRSATADHDTGCALVCQKLETDREAPAVFSNFLVKPTRSSSAGRSERSSQSLSVFKPKTQSSQQSTELRENPVKSFEEREEPQGRKALTGEDGPPNLSQLNDQSFAIAEEEEDEEVPEKGEIMKEIPVGEDKLKMESEVPEPLPQINSIEDVEYLLRKYDLIWRERAKALRGQSAPTPPPAASDGNSCADVESQQNESQNSAEDTSASKTENKDTATRNSESLLPSEISVLSDSENAVEISEDIHDGDINARSERERSRIETPPTPDKRRGSAHSSTKRVSMKVNAFGRAHESIIEVQIPQPVKEYLAEEEGETVPDLSLGQSSEELPFPPFAELNTPNNYVHSFKKPGELLPLRSRKLPLEPTSVDPKLTILEDWFLDDNAYSQNAKANANWLQMMDDRGPPVPITPEKPHIPGLSPHGHHHHAHIGISGVEAPIFSCDPQHPIVYTEAIEAENQLESNRPRYLVPGQIFGSNMLRVADVNTSQPSAKQPISSHDEPSGLCIQGKSVPIAHLDIGAASVGLGLSWSPAPPKLSLPMKLYKHFHSLPGTPRAFSRQGVKTGTASFRSRSPTQNLETIQQYDNDDIEISFQDVAERQAQSPKKSQKRVSRPRNTPIADIHASSLDDSLNEKAWVKTSSVRLFEADENMETDFVHTESDVGTFEDTLAIAILEESQECLSIFDASEAVLPDPAVVPSDVAEPSDEVCPKSSQDVTDPKIEAPEAIGEGKEKEATVEETSEKQPQLSPEDEANNKQVAEVEASVPAKKSIVATKRRTLVSHSHKKVQGTPIAASNNVKNKSKKPHTRNDANLPDISARPESGESVSRPSVALSEDPAAFYKRRRLSRMQSAGTMLSSASSVQHGSFEMSSSSFKISMDSSNSSMNPKKNESDKNTKSEKKPAFEESKGPDWYSTVHSEDDRKKLLSPAERAKYPTFTDTGSIEDLIAIEGDSCLDPSTEIEKVTHLITASNLPIPAFLRRRGILLGRVTRYEEAMADLTKAIQYDPFNSDALWHRHQLFLRWGDTERALKDLDAITEINKQHLGAFMAKARIYEELTSEERISGLPLEATTIGFIKMAIVNYSQIIRLKPESAEGYYHRACLFEAENETVYANEDFRMVRQLDPSNEHAIHNLAVYSFQRELWDDGIQAFTKLIALNPENGQAYLYRGRANAYLAKWEEALRDLTLAVQLAPERPDVYYYRGCLLRERNKRKAIEDFSVSILLDDGPTNAEAFFQRGRTWLKCFWIDKIQQFSIISSKNTNWL
ncbi:cytochrome c oxidase subunit 1 [Entophlyctis luteolus]|nr:cytochrome c oxidase subunit 1 [Entophlyctis luteolus]